MNYQPHYPNWQYSLLSIPQWESIQQELTQMFWRLIDQEPSGATFVSLDSNHSEWKQLTELNGWLESVGAGADKWKSGYYSITNNGDLCPIHVDYAGNKNFLTINFPLINCHDSYTVWYDTDIDYNLPIKETEFDNNTRRLLMYEETTENYDSTACSFWCKQDDSVELNRVECTMPMIANVSLPHRPVVTHNQLRVLFSLRIRPELSLSDVARLGVTQPFVQSD
jgi:hypothetical protein